MRYLAHLAYKGTHFAGYQIQPNIATIQSEIEASLATILRTKIDVVGCGRTDTGVHAHCYYLHFEYEGGIPKNLVYKLNSLINKDIVFYKIIESHLHARFDATYRKYIYKLTALKSPFEQETIFTYPPTKDVDLNLMNEAAQLLLQYDDFNTFCKTGHQSFTTICKLTECRWVMSEDKKQWHFHIAADRFLRGMVRLIVGMCINVGLGKISLEDVKIALDQKEKLAQNHSVPAHGLSLVDVRY